MPAEALLIRGARLLDPAHSLDDCRDLGVRDGRFAEPATLPPDTPSLRLNGLVIAPGLIDLHVHLREPGQTHKEDIASGTAAAAAGGFTTILAMPNTLPATDTPGQVRELRGRYAAAAAVRVLQSGALTRNRAGSELADFAGMKAAGIAALTDDGATPQNPALMREACRRAAALGLPVIDHCEDTALAHGGAMREGETARHLGAAGIPALAEELIVARDILLAADTGAHLHLQHLSSGRSVALVRWAKRQGWPVTAETTPHHLLLTAAAVATHGANAKMNPPLGDEADRQALIAGLRDGTLDAIATDHAPHAADEKGRGLEAAPFGIIGLETALALCLTALADENGPLTLTALLRLFTAGPRRILGLEAGTLAPGAPADFIVLDPAAEWTLTPADLRSKSANTPFLGQRCRGRVLQTWLAGRRIFAAP
jgi:dihydroorotase